MVWCCECQQNASQKSRYDTWYMAACAGFSSPKKRKGPWKGYENRFTWDIKVSTKLAKNLFVWDFFFSDQKQRDLWSLDISDHAESWSLLQKVFAGRFVILHVALQLVWELWNIYTCILKTSKRECLLKRWDFKGKYRTFQKGRTFPYMLALFVPNMLKGLSPIRLFIHRSCIYNNRSPYQWKVPIPPIGLVDRPYILRITGSKLYCSIHWSGFGGSQLQMKYLSCGNLSIPPCPRNISFRHPPPHTPPR